MKRASEEGFYSARGSDRGIPRLLAKAVDRRAEFSTACSSTDAWRMVNGSADGMLGLTADRFGRAVLVEAHRADADADALIRAIRERLGDATPIFFKARWSMSAPGWPGAQVLGPVSSSRLVVGEDGVAFAVDLIGKEHVGLFLDSRPARRFVRGIADGAKVLNLFSYTGGFAVAATAGGARGTVNVDNKRSALEGARENYRINDLASDTRTFARSDAARYVAKCVRAGERFDLVILDPPPRYKRPGRPDYNSRDGYAPLAARAMTAVCEGGVLLAGLNDPAVDDSRFERLLEEAAALAGRRVEVEHRIGPGPDFPPSPEQPVARFLACRVGRGYSDSTLGNW